MFGLQNLLTLSLLLSSLSVANAGTLSAHGARNLGAHHRRLSARSPQPPFDTSPLALRSPESAPAKRGHRKRGTCRPNVSSSSTSSSAKSTSTGGAVVNVGGDTTAAATTTTEKAGSTATKTTTTAGSSTTTSGSSNSGGSSSSNGNIPGAPVKPSDWPTKTQAGATYSATAASASDPYLESISDALNNDSNDYFTQTHTGDLTYYGQGLTACGDTYTDDTYTAAVSMLMFDTWPGATGEQNRNAICGPWTTGRSAITDSGTFKTVVQSSEGIVVIGGDGLPNCGAAVGQVSQCHVPLTATIRNPANGKSVVVKVVDRCVGCKMNDIDVTITAFTAIADEAEGRVPGIEWSFNKI